MNRDTNMTIKTTIVIFIALVFLGMYQKNMPFHLLAILDNSIVFASLLITSAGVAFILAIFVNIVDAVAYEIYSFFRKED